MDDLTQLKQELRFITRFLYDIQKLRIATSLRDQRTRNDDSPDIQLEEKSQVFMTGAADNLLNLEKGADRRLGQILRKFPIYTEFLKQERGVGVRMASVLVSEVDIHKAETVSALWRYCGLAVDLETGRAERRSKGKKLHYNPWLKSKIIEVLGKSMIKAGAPLEPDLDKGRKKGREASEWYLIYVGRKNRRENQKLDVCMGCNGKGKRNAPVTRKELGIVDPTNTKKLPTKKSQCWNCEGTGGPAPWGCDKKHREIDARRVMVKQFLVSFYNTYRQLEGLSIRPPYAEEYLGKVHHK